MLDRRVVEEFLFEEAKDAGMSIPKRIAKENWWRHFVDSQKGTTMNG